MSKNNRHVVPNPEGGWDVRAPGASRASSHHDTQADAIDRGREIVGNAGGGELLHHGEELLDDQRGEPHRQLVEQEQRRVARQRAGQRHHVAAVRQVVM